MQQNDSLVNGAGRTWVPRRSSGPSSTTTSLPSGCSSTPPASVSCRRPARSKTLATRWLVASGSCCGLLRLCSGFAADKHCVSPDFSPTFDLSRTVQAQKAPGPGQKQAGAVNWRHAWDEYWFNRHVSERMRQFECAAPWVVVVMCGFVAAEALPTAGSPADSVALELLLISRRHCGRAGTRYHHRGIDDQGSCANTVLTEQLLQRRSATGPLS